MSEAHAEASPASAELDRRLRAALARAGDAIGQAQDFLEDAVQDRPLATLAMVAAIAFAIGHVLGRR